MSETYLNRLKKVSVENVSDVFDSMKISQQIVNFSQSNIHPINTNRIICGLAFPVILADTGDQREALYNNTRDFLDHVPHNNVIIILNESSDNKYSTWGYLLSCFAEKKQISGTITTGCTRDIDDIRNHQYPVFSAGHTCIRGTGHYKLVGVQKTIKIDHVIINPGDYMIASSSGIAIIKPDQIEKVLECAERINENEKLILGLIAANHSIGEIQKMMESKMQTK
jgi:4-hydroxy-4-methyl-2-oxoglutarate aldolase